MSREWRVYTVPLSLSLSLQSNKCISICWSTRVVAQHYNIYIVTASITERERTTTVPVTCGSGLNRWGFGGHTNTRFLTIEPKHIYRSYMAEPRVKSFASFWAISLQARRQPKKKPAQRRKRWKGRRKDDLLYIRDLSPHGSDTRHTVSSEAWRMRGCNGVKLNARYGLIYSLSLDSTLVLLRELQDDPLLRQRPLNWLTERFILMMCICRLSLSLFLLRVQLYNV